MPDRPMPPSSGLPSGRLPSSTPPAGTNPPNWADAFAALPAETPPADGWARTAARLSDRRASAPAAAFVAPAAAPPRAAISAQRRWALAAMLAAALPLGLWLSLRASRPLPDAVPSAIVQEAASQDSAPRQRVAPASGRDPAPAVAASIDANGDAGRVAASEVPRAATGPGIGETRHAATPATATTSDAPRTARAATAPKSSRNARAIAADPQRSLARREPRRDQTPAVATTSATDTNAASDAATPAATADDTRLIAQLRELQAESAQLEALVAVTRDDRVASAAAAVMSADLDQRLRLIDTALGDAALPTATRAALWRERVDSLRSLAGVESTQRWYAARGERYDGALVRVD